MKPTIFVFRGIHFAICVKKLKLVKGLILFVLFALAYVYLYNEMSIHGKVVQIKPTNVSVKRYRDLNTSSYLELWNDVDSQIGNGELFPERSNVEVVLRALRTAKILSVKHLDKQTSFKWKLRLDGQQPAIFKPFLISPRDDISYKRSMKCNRGVEHPSSEIAAFYIHRIIGKRNCPFTTGRIIDLEREILPLVTNIRSLKLYRHPQNNSQLCLTMKCIMCHQRHRIVPHCPRNNLLYGSIKYWVRGKLRNVSTKDSEHLYGNIENRNSRFQNLWIGDNSYSDIVKRKQRYYNDSGLFLEMTDISILQFLVADVDYKPVVMLDSRNQPIMLLCLDYGLAFCRLPLIESKQYLAMAMMYQTCRVKMVTYYRLKDVQAFGISKLFVQETREEPNGPLLDSEDLTSLEKRLDIIMHVIKICALLNGGFDNIFF